MSEENSSPETPDARGRPRQLYLFLAKIVSFFALLIALLVLPRRYWLWALLVYAVVAATTWTWLIVDARRARSSAPRDDS